MSETRRIKREPRPREMHLEHFKAGMLAVARREIERQRREFAAIINGGAGLNSSVFNPQRRVSERRDWLD